MIAPRQSYFYFSSLCLILISFQALAETKSPQTLKLLPPAWLSPLVEEIYPEADPETLEKEESVPLEVEKAAPSLNYEQVMNARVKVITYRRPRDFDYEFTLLVVDGKIQRAFVVSTAMPRQRSILGYHLLTVPRRNDLPQKPWPWRVSKSYYDSPMYWALHIKGGYFIHSSPHYGNLGKPASMGCIRESIPDAMEVFDTVANRFADFPSYSMIYDHVKLGSKTEGEKVLEKTLSDSGWTIEDLKQALAKSRKEVLLVSKGDLEYKRGVPVDAHVRALGNLSQKESSFPTCGGENCWDFFSKKRTTLKLKPEVALSSPTLQRFEAVLPIWVSGLILASTSARFQQYKLNEILGRNIETLDATYIYDVTLTITSGSSPLMIRICDLKAKQCSQTQGPEAGASAKIVFPMAKIASLLKSSKDLVMELQSGNGTLTNASAQYYQAGKY